MRDTFFRLWVHTIFKVEENTTLIDPALESLFHQEIEKRLIEQGCEVAAVGGMPDHVHCIFTQNPLLSVHETVRFVQGISERWYQQHDFKTAYYKFRWAHGYHAFSLSPHSLMKTKKAVDNQCEWHQSKGVDEELKEWRAWYNVDDNG